MPNLLGRELTAPEQTVKAALEGGLRGRPRDLETVLQSLASSTPEEFFAAALSLLGSTDDASARRRIYDAVAGRVEFWIELLRPTRFSRFELLDICRHLKRSE